MKYNQLGGTGLSVSQIGFGCGNVGGLMIRGNRKEREHAVSCAIDLGINYFDTAPSYGNGLSEINLGQALRDLKKEPYIGTKFRIGLSDIKDIKKSIISSIEQSLKRLGREHIQLIQLHNRIAVKQDVVQDILSVQDILIDVRESFNILKRQGKVSFWGITALGDTGAVHKVIESCKMHSIQTVYNLLNQTAGGGTTQKLEDQDFKNLIDKAALRKIGVIVIRPLAGGALTGSNIRHPVASPAPMPMGSSLNYSDDVERTKKLGFLEHEGHLENLIEAAIRLPVGNIGVSTILVGFSSISQIKQSVDYALKGRLPFHLIKRLE